jgi:hypothetical protein
MKIHYIKIVSEDYIGTIEKIKVLEDNIKYSIKKLNISFDEK